MLQSESLHNLDLSSHLRSSYPEVLVAQSDDEVDEFLVFTEEFHNKQGAE